LLQRGQPKLPSAAGTKLGSGLRSTLRDKAPIRCGCANVVLRQFNSSLAADQPGRRKNRRRRSPGTSSEGLFYVAAAGGAAAGGAATNGGNGGYHGPSWSYDYNNVRPHSSLGNPTPAEARRTLELFDGPAPGALAQPKTDDYQQARLSL
jgi:transposase InsO family protein